MNPPLEKIDSKRPALLVMDYQIGIIDRNRNCSPSRGSHRIRTSSL